MKTYSRVTSSFFYPSGETADDSLCFHYKQDNIELTVDQKGRFHGAVTIGTNTETPDNQPESKISLPKKKFAIQDLKVIELSEKSYEVSEESEEAEFQIDNEEYILDDETKDDKDIERRIFVLPTSLSDSLFKYGFELFSEYDISKRFQETNPRVAKVGNDYINMKTIPTINEFVVSKDSEIDSLLLKADCKAESIVDQLKKSFKDSFWAYRLSFDLKKKQLIFSYSFRCFFTTLESEFNKMFDRKKGNYRVHEKISGLVDGLVVIFGVNNS